MPEQKQEKKLEPCRNCKSEVELKSRICPYCGILNPTVKVSEIVLTMAIVLLVMGFITYFIKN